MPRHSAPLKHAWIRPRLLVTLAVASAGLATAIWLPTRNDSADASEWRNNTIRTIASLEEFSDEFRGREGSTVDPQKWFLNTASTGNGLTFSQSTRNARLDGDGNLVIVARDSDRNGLTSAQLVSRSLFRRASGQIEAKIKVPDGDGLRPAFALFGANRTNPAAVNLLTDPIEDGEFHTYALAWTPDSVTLSRDGEVLQQTAAPQNGTDQLFRLSLSLFVTDAREADLPARMTVDFVRLGALPATPEPSAPPATPSSPAPATTAPAESPTTVPPTTPPVEESTAPPATTEPPAAPPTTSAPAAAAAPAWKAFTDYKVGDVVKFKGADYRVLEAHTSLPGWEPTTLVSLFKKV